MTRRRQPDPSCWAERSRFDPTCLFRAEGFFITLLDAVDVAVGVRVGVDVGVGVDVTAAVEVGVGVVEEGGSP